MLRVWGWMRAVIMFWEPPLAWWLVWWHGEGEAHQYQFYRCHACRALVTFHTIRAGGCPCHESSKISPTILGRLTKARILCLPWTVTRPSIRREAVRRTRLAAERELEMRPGETLGDFMRRSGT